MKKFLLTQFLLLLFLNGFTQTNTIQVQDTMHGTAQSWRDTCFGLINKSGTLIPSGYLLDYSLVDSTFKGFNPNDTITESGNIFALLNVFNLGAETEILFSYFKKYFILHFIPLSFTIS